MSTATATAPPTPAALRRLGVDDPARFQVLRRVPIFDEHTPELKYITDRARRTASNPEGIVPVRLGATRSDLEQLARNSNARALSGRLAALQLGHSLPWDAPEAQQPKAVGFPFNFAVGEHEGRACLFADLAYRAEHYEEAATYPRGSIERSGWTTPDLQHVQALALIRCRPGRDLPAIAYAAGPDRPMPAPSAWQAGRDERVTAILRRQQAERVADARGRAEAARPAPMSRVDFATRHRIRDQRELDRRYSEAYPAAPAAVAYAARAQVPPRRPSLVDFAVARRIFDPEMARRQYALAFPDPDVPPARYSAGPPAVATIPSDPRALMEMRSSPAYSAARREYAEKARVWAIVQAGHDLEREVAAGLLAFDAASGRLRFPEPPTTADDPAATPTAEAHWRARRAAFWAAGGAIGPDGTPRFAQVEADPRPRVDARGAPTTVGGPRVTPAGRKALGLDVDFGRDANAVPGPADPNPRLPGR